MRILVKLQPRSQRGLSLVEALISLVILSMGLAAISTLTQNLVQAYTTAHHRAVVSEEAGHLETSIRTGAELNLLRIQYTNWRIKVTAIHNDFIRTTPAMPLKEIELTHTPTSQSYSFWAEISE